MIAPFTSPTDIGAATYRRPYLNLKERLTQAILNPYTVFLFLLILKIFFFIRSLNNSFDHAKKQTELFYASTQAYVNNAVSFPHYMAQGANFAIAEGLDETNKGFIESLKLMLTAAEQLIFFMIELSVGTYVCLLMAVVDSTASAALNATEDIISVANETLASFAKELNMGLEGMSDILNDVIDTAEDTGDALKHMFGGSGDQKSLKVNEEMAHVNLTIKNMQDWIISASINSDIENLRGKVPDFDDVKNYTQDLINIPFEEVKKQVNKNLNKTFDSSALYVPAKKTIELRNVTGSINKFYDHAQHLAAKSGHIIMILISIAMIAFIGYTFYLECLYWSRLQYASKKLCIANESYVETTDKKKFNAEVISTMQDFRNEQIGRFVSVKIMRMKSPVFINNSRWLINYMASPYLSSFVLLGFLGILSFSCQYIILVLLQNGHGLIDADNVFNKTTIEIKTSLNESVYDWSHQTNLYLQNYQKDMNENLLGWIGTGTMAINKTVTEFDEKMNDAIDVIFKETPLYSFVEKIVWCVVESKLRKIESAMTWLNENAKLDIAEIDPSQLYKKIINLKDDDGDSELNNSLTDLKDEATQLFTKVLEFYRKQTFLTLYISLGIIGLWFLFALLGLGILFFRERRIHQMEIALNGKNPDPNLRDSTDMILTPKYQNSSIHLTTANILSGIYDNVRNKYSQKNNYIRTPVELVDDKMSKLRGTLGPDPYNEIQRDSLYSLWETIPEQNCNEILYEEQKESFMQNFINDEHTVSSSRYARSIDDEDMPDATLSEIDENISSLQHARRWTP